MFCIFEKGVHTVNNHKSEHKYQNLANIEVSKFFYIDKIELFK